ncbi:TetR/AcrR family transcriptional regulator [Pseudodonghicola flavimaris]|uniref:TetR/AcrR family transcriptional regulator n=1 Tax=Pseudodonghicola flavimaris TaxID=3050036 RepID=A0ABT7EY01_9RHOB|nr:TetR/AcrR family transcriptional regulator [Pseudodonghicola flavimaris]MDK3017209.1 TetR/AcrR family transcriptional regulator [Pseudodonghicola flavimaris]
MEKQRKRAPSQRSLQTREKILDAAERVFAERGFDGASIRDIAAAAGVQAGLVHHHGGSKEALFARTVARRAETLSQLRLDALENRRAAGPLTARDLLDCFMGPYIHMAGSGGPQWLAYARLVAHVSADPRWRDLAADWFDPTARRFIAELAALSPGADPRRVAAGFVYAVAAMLAHLTSGWRVGALGLAEGGAEAGDLLDFCVAGIEATLAPAAM